MVATVCPVQDLIQMLGPMRFEVRLRFSTQTDLLPRWIRCGNVNPQGPQTWAILPVIRWIGCVRVANALPVSAEPTAARDALHADMAGVAQAPKTI